MIDHQRPRRGFIRALPGPRVAGLVTSRRRQLPHRRRAPRAGRTRGQAPRALRDIQAGQAAGRFTIPSAELALAAVAGDLLGLLWLWLHQRHPDRIAQTSVDRLAEATLRLLHVPAAEAARLVTLRLNSRNWYRSRVTVLPVCWTAARRRAAITSSLRKCTREAQTVRWRITPIG
jgi:Tetracyclin repressor-like, C-terminal domain